MSDTAALIMNIAIALGILFMVVCVAMRKNHRHIPSQELRSSDISHAFRRIQRP